MVHSFARDGMLLGSAGPPKISARVHMPADAPLLLRLAPGLIVNPGYDGRVSSFVSRVSVWADCGHESTGGVSAGRTERVR